MREGLVGIRQDDVVQTYPILINQAAAFTATGYQIGPRKNIQEGLLRVEPVFVHLLRQCPVLKHPGEVLLGLPTNTVLYWAGGLFVGSLFLGAVGFFVGKMRE